MSKPASDDDRTDNEESDKKLTTSKFKCSYPKCVYASYKKEHVTKHEKYYTHLKSCTKGGTLSNSACACVKCEYCDYWSDRKAKLFTYMNFCIV